MLVIFKYRFFNQIMRHGTPFRIWIHHVDSMDMVQILSYLHSLLEVKIKIFLCFLVVEIQKLLTHPQKRRQTHIQSPI